MSGSIQTASPEDTSRLFIEAVHQGDVDTLVALYEPGGGLFLTSKGGFTTNRDAIRAAFEELVALKPKMVVKELVVTMHEDGTLATTRMRLSLDGTAPDGTAIHEEYHTLEVQRKQPDGTWRFAIDDPHGSERS